MSAVFWGTLAWTIGCAAYDYLWRKKVAREIAREEEEELARRQRPRYGRTSLTPRDKTDDRYDLRH